MSVATISLSELAPNEAVTFTLANVTFELGGRRKTYDTDDRQVISDAEVHPFLSVAVHPVKEDDAEAAEKAVEPVAIDAGLKQTTSVVEGGVDLTLAADDTSKTAKKKD